MTDAVPTLHLPDFGGIPLVGCAPAAWACQLALEEKSVPREDRWLDAPGGVHRDPTLLRHDTRGTLPVLVHGAEVLRGVQAILAYIELAWPTPVLLPPRFRGAALSRLHEANHLLHAGTDLFGWLAGCAPADRTPDRLAPRLTVLWRELQRWEAHLDDQDFVAGPWLSLADLLVYPCVATAQRLGMALDPDLPRLAGHARRMRSRSAVIRSWPEPWAVDPTERPLAGL